MKNITLVIGLCMIAGFAYADISITQLQFDNIDILYAALKEKDVNFIALEGPKDAIKVYGISEEDAIKEIDKIDLDAEIIDKEDKKKDKKKDDALEALGLTREDIEKIKALP